MDKATFEGLSRRTVNHVLNVCAKYLGRPSNEITKILSCEATLHWAREAPLERLPKIDVMESGAMEYKISITYPEERMQLDFWFDLMIVLMRRTNHTENSAIDDHSDGE